MLLIFFVKGNMMKTWLRFTFVFLFALVLVAGTARPVAAAYIDDDGKIGTDEVIDDDVLVEGDHVVVDGTVNGILFAFGETVTINGKVNGDVFAAGSTVEISSTAEIDGNVFMGGQTIRFEGKSTGSVFGGGSEMTLEETASVARNLYFGGFSFKSQSGSLIERDQFTGSYQALVSGEVGRDIQAAANAVELNGKVGRNVQIYMNETTGESMDRMPEFVPYMPVPVEPGLRVSEDASVGGTMTYTSPVPQTDTIQGVAPEQLIYQTPMPVPEDPQRPIVRPRIETRLPVLHWFFDFLRELAALLIFGGLALWLMPKVTQKVIDQARANPLPSAGYGLLTVLLGWVIAFVAASLIFGVGLLLTLLTLGAVSGPVFGLGFSALGLAVAVFGFLVSTGSKVVFSVLIGQLLVGKIAPQASHPKVWALLTGVLIYALIRPIFLLGWLVAIIATVVGVGAMYLAYRAGRAPAAPAVVEIAAAE